MSIYRKEIHASLTSTLGEISLRDIMSDRNIKPTKATYVIDAMKKMINEGVVRIVTPSKKSKWLDATYAF